MLAAGFVGRRQPASVPGELIRLWLAGSFGLITSAYIIDEVRSTLVKPYFVLRHEAADVTAALDLLDTDATIVPITVAVRGVVADPDDDPVLATALSAGAPYLVSGDGALLALGSYRDVPVLTPRAFLALLDDAPET